MYIQVAESFCCFQLTTLDEITTSQGLTPQRGSFSSQQSLVTFWSLCRDGTPEIPPQVLFTQPFLGETFMADVLVPWLYGLSSPLQGCSLSHIGMRCCDTDVFVGAGLPMICGSLHVSSCGFLRQAFCVLYSHTKIWTKSPICERT